MIKKRRRDSMFYLLDEVDDPNKKVKLFYSVDDGKSNKSEAMVQFLDNRIYFTGRVNTDSVTNLIKQINYYNSEFNKLQIVNQNVANITPKPIYLHIQTYGGSLLACFAAIDTIRDSKIPIYTVIDGYAASCGSLMALVGKKRFMKKNAFNLMHQLSSGVIGKMNDIVDEYENCSLFMERIYDIYTRYTKLTKEELKKQMEHDHWWDSKKCLEFGLIDEILE